MKIVSQVFDKRINAWNILMEMTIQEYLKFGKQITEKNEFQRKKVRRSSSVYQLLKDDLLSGCLMPPIVLAVHSNDLTSDSFSENISNEEIQNYLTPEKLIILDGLQRTYTLMQIVENLISEESTERLKDFHSNFLRVEVYLGLSRTGVLYRMLTLNTGQTPMSTRHQIEILYSDYRDQPYNGIELFTETDSSRVRGIGQYQFRDVVEGFNSYLERNELGIDRAILLENIENLEKLAKEDQSADLFGDYILSYNKIAQRFQQVSNSWTFNSEECSDIIGHPIDNPFAKNTLDLFTKKQMLSGYGAAIGKLKDFGLIDSFSDATRYFQDIEFSENSYEDIYLFLDKMAHIKEKARKIGQAQRFYITHLFRELLNKDSESFQNFKSSVNRAFEKYQYELG